MAVQNDLIKKMGLANNWLTPCFKWSGRVDLNHRPSEPHSDTLPDCATPRLDDYIKIQVTLTIIVWTCQGQ